jgi:zinc protease
MAPRRTPSLLLVGLLVLAAGCAGRVLDRSSAATLPAVTHPAVSTSSSTQAVPAGRIPLDALLPLAPEVRKGRLENGLTYLIRANRRPEARAELRLVVDAGSVLEDEDQRGLAHFVEHMAFNGTRDFERQELIDYLESIGMRFGPELNASTGFDETVYYLTVPTDQPGVMGTAFQILENWAWGISFPPVEIDKERGVIIEEWRMGRGASARMLDKQLPVLLRDSKYARRLPIGDRETLETFDHESLRRFYRDWYQPANMAVIAVGDFDVDEVEGMIRERFGSWTGSAAPRVRPDLTIPSHTEALFAIASDPEASGTSVAVYYKRPPEPDGTAGDYRRGLVQALYNSMLNDRLAELILQAAPPFLGASSGLGSLARAGSVYTLGAAVDEGKVLPGLEALLIEAERVARHGFTPTELERHKQELLRGIQRAYDERERTYSSSYAAEYQRHFLADEPIPGITYEYALYQRFVPGITLEAVDALAGELITDHDRVIMVNAPAKEGVPVPTEEELLGVFQAVAAAEVAPYEDEVTGGALVDRVPTPGRILEEHHLESVDVTEWRLSNGVRVVLKPTDFQADQILFEAFSPGGTSLVPDEDFIPASSAASVMSASGVGGFDVVQLHKELAGKAVSVSPSISGLEEGLSGSASPKDIETLFELIYLYMTEPRADSTAFRSMVTRGKAIMANRDAVPMMALIDTLTVILGQNHPRARIQTAATYDEMDLMKSFDFYRDRFSDAGDFTFVFVGNLDLEVMRPLVETWLAGLPAAGRVETWRDVGPDTPRGVFKREVHKGKEPQSVSVLVLSGPMDYSRENAHLLRSVVEVLDIRLREKLREDLSGTYGVNVMQTASDIPDPEYSVQIMFGSAPERAEELITTILEEMEVLKRDGPTTEELQKVTEAQRRERETSLEQNGYWLGQLGSRYRRGIDPAEILTFEQLIDDLDVERLRQAARTFFDLQNYIQITLFPEGGR